MIYNPKKIVLALVYAQILVIIPLYNPLNPSLSNIDFNAYLIPLYLGTKFLFYPSWPNIKLKWILYSLVFIKSKGWKINWTINEEFNATIACEKNLFTSFLSIE